MISATSFYSQKVETLRNSCEFAPNPDAYPEMHSINVHVERRLQENKRNSTTHSYFQG